MGLILRSHRAAPKHRQPPWWMVGMSRLWSRKTRRNNVSKAVEVLIRCSISLSILVIFRACTCWQHQVFPASLCWPAPAVRLYYAANFRRLAERIRFCRVKKAESDQRLAKHLVQMACLHQYLFLFCGAGHNLFCEVLNEIFRGYDFTGSQIFDFPIYFCIGFTTVQPMKCVQRN